MPILTCPVCRFASHLPDPWYHPGFTCGSCGSAVAIAAPPPVVIVPTVASGFDLTDKSDRPARSDRVHNYRNRTRAGDAFATGFGDSVGREFGKLVFYGLVFGSLVAVVVLFTFWAKYGR